MVNVFARDRPALRGGELAQLTKLILDFLPFVLSADSCVNRRFHLAPAFGPGVLSIFRALAMSALLHRQSVRPPPIGTATARLIFPSASQRLIVRRATPILAAASRVL